MTETNSVPLSVFENFVSTVSQISSQTDASEVALIIIDEACKILNCERSSFFFVDGEYLDLVIGKGADTIRLPISSGIAGACATSGQILNIPDPYSDSRFNADFDRKSDFKTRTLLAAPVRDPEGEIVGVLQAINKNGGPFSEVDEKLVNCLAGQVGVSIRYTYQMEQAEYAKKQRNALVSCIRDITGNTNVQHLLFTLNKAAIQLVDADRCTFYTINHTTHTLHLVKADAVVDISFPMDKGIAGYVATSGKILNIDDAYTDSRFNPDFDRRTGYRTRSMLVLPVFSFNEEKENKIIGVLQMINKAHDSVFTTDDEEVLEILMRFVGPIIATSSLFIVKIQEKEIIKARDIVLTRKPSKDLLVSTPRAIPQSILEEGTDEDKMEITFEFEGN